MPTGTPAAEKAHCQSISSTQDSACLLGVRVHALSIEQVIVFIERTIQLDGRAIIANVNIHALNLAFDLPWFRDFLNRSDLVFCDGFGVKWGARFLGCNLPARFTPPDWITTLAETACRHDLTFFFLGAHRGVAERAATNLQRQVPNLRVVGTHHGYFDCALGSAENEQVIRRINSLHPNILLVGLGMPLQERWLMENWERVHANVAMPVGALFDYLAGHVRRPPRWMTDSGFEWLGRFVIEPRRLWKRYLVGNPLFAYRVLKQRLGLLRVD